MRFLLAYILFVAITQTSANAQNTHETKPFGIGIRVGDFNGFSAKYYIEDAGICVEGNVGRSYFSGDKYSKRFDIIANEEEIDYVGYDESRTFERQSLGFRIDLQKYGTLGGTPHFYWYAGGGVQARIFTLLHSYSYEITALNSSTTRISNDGEYESRHQSFGVNGVLGAEYIFQEIPFSIFADALIFLEAYEVTGNIIAQFGLGTRFQF